MCELLHDAVVVLLGDAVGIRAEYLDVLANGRGEQQLDLVVVVVVISDAEQRVNVVPYGATEQARVDALVTAHSRHIIPRFNNTNMSMRIRCYMYRDLRSRDLRVVRHVACYLEVLVEQLANLRIDGEGGRVSLILPRVVLEAERRIGVLEVEMSTVGVVSILAQVGHRALGHNGRGRALRCL